MGAKEGSLYLTVDLTFGEEECSCSTGIAQGLENLKFAGKSTWFLLGAQIQLLSHPLANAARETEVLQL
jgi:hypothetical protein